MAYVLHLVNEKMNRLHLSGNGVNEVMHLAQSLYGVKFENVKIVEPLSVFQKYQSHWKK